eukprot:ANDGO_04477.mRNA.1 hypothetical protein
MSSNLTISELANSSAVRLRADISKRRHRHLQKNAEENHQLDVRKRSSDRTWSAAHECTFERMLRSRDDIRKWFSKYSSGKIQDPFLSGFSEYHTASNEQHFQPHPPTGGGSPSTEPRKYFGRTKSLAQPACNSSVVIPPLRLDKENLAPRLPLIEQTRYCISARDERSLPVYQPDIPLSSRRKAERKAFNVDFMQSAKYSIERGRSVLRTPWAVNTDL